LFIIHRSSFIMLAAALLLAACGFQLRGAATFPFDSLYVGAAPGSELAVRLKRAVAAGGQARVTGRPDEAQAVLQITNEVHEKHILALSGGGRVREYELRYRVAYRLTDSKGAANYIPPSEIVLRRDFSFNDSEALAKEAEEALLYRDMQSDAVHQLVRRLQAVRLPARS
jgi:LPS-assembly lipoprotein